MKKQINDKELKFESGLVNKGNAERYLNAVKKAEAGDTVNLAFIGGSITQGCHALKHEDSFSYLVYKWWCSRFQNTTNNYINAGVGGTTSQYGVSRVEEEVLSKNPDVVFVEFSVNDESSDFYLETYESLVRRIYFHSSNTAVILIHNVEYDNGFSSEDIHFKIGRNYDLPCISMKPVIYESLKRGDLRIEDITNDGLHPNDYGHSLVSKVIISGLMQMEESSIIAQTMMQMEESSVITSCRFENSYAIKNNDSHISENIYADIILDGFTKDINPKQYDTDFFKNGWTGRNKSDRIIFEVYTNYIAIQYRKTINKPAPIAKAVIDDENEFILDANFEEDWGDKLHIDTVLIEKEYRKHKIAIEIISEDDVVSDFYLLSLIINKKVLVIS